MVGSDAFANAALVTILKIGGDNCASVICSVGESSPPIAIAQGIDAGHIGAELIINLDVPALIHCDPCVLQTEISCVRHAAYREKHVRANDYLIAAGAIDTDRYPVAALS